MIKTLLLAELKKSRHSFVLWLVLFGALFLPVLFFIIYLFRWRYFIPEAGSSAWDGLLDNLITIASSFFMPLLVIMLVAFYVQLEFKANSWKTLFVMPVDRGRLFLGKTCFLTLLLFVCLVLFVAGMLLTGLLAGLFHPELGFLQTPPDLGKWVVPLIRLFFNLLSIMILQLIISLVFSQVGVPITLGIFLFFASVFVAAGWKYSQYNPYCFSYLFSRELSGEYRITRWQGIPMTDLQSVAYWLFGSLAGMSVFKQLTLR